MICFEFLSVKFSWLVFCLVEIMCSGKGCVCCVVGGIVFLIVVKGLIIIVIR